MSHLAGGAVKQAVRGTVTFAGNGAITGGTLNTTLNTTPITVQSSATYGVKSTGAFAAILPQSNGTTGHVVGQLQRGSGVSPFVASHSVASVNLGDADYFKNPDKPSLMLWVH